MKSQKIRLQKYLSQAGVASRREAERLMLRGRISVNGRVVSKPGTLVDLEDDRVELDGRKVIPQEKFYLMLHKPSGYLCALKDGFGRPLVTDLIKDIPARLYHAGRLDLDSEGLLIMTNDGDFSQCITHPSHRVEKIYFVKLKSPLDNRQKTALSSGVRLDDGLMTGAARVRIVSRDRRRVEIAIREGKKRQVRRMLKAVGNQVMYLKRIAIGPVKLGDLPTGKWRKLTAAEIQTLKTIGDNR
ncbi:MAG: pseudouridine synthase [Candidatus Euphemobacter frigidus]|nr:pseudouridine synthase [Candidatus Euphemobacter frigidus]MDP8276796.1 pseudouridine synthase [Candidatus Euphemobacter frigidus]